MNMPNVSNANYAPAQSANSSKDSSSLFGKTAGGSMGKDEFVKLLVAQMSNQDPLNPMDGKELAVQLAQFSSIEQLLNINTKLDELIATVKPAVNASQSE